MMGKRRRPRRQQRHHRGVRLPLTIDVDDAAFDDPVRVSRKSTRAAGAAIGHFSVSGNQPNFEARRT